MSLFSRKSASAREVLEADRLRIAERNAQNTQPATDALWAEPTAADKLPMPRLQPGDKVWHAEGGECVVQRIGWHDGPSPYYGDTTLRAYVVSAYWNEGNYFMDWAPVHELTPTAEAVNENAPGVFTESVL